MGEWPRYPGVLTSQGDVITNSTDQGELKGSPDYFMAD
jgi:hypothetical protein